MDSEDAYEMIFDDESQLPGVPPSVIERLKAKGIARGKPGKLVVTVGGDGDIYKYCSDFEVSARLDAEIGNLASQEPYDNGQRALEVLNLRYEKAFLLGKKSWADFILEDQMAKTPEAVVAFEEEALSVYKEAAERERAEIRGLAARHDISDPQPWHMAYFNHMLKEQKFDFDDEAVRPYLPLKNVMAGIAEHERRFLGYQMTPNDEIPVWHSSVKAYEVREDDRTIAIFYDDVFLRQDEKEGRKDFGSSNNEIRAAGLHKGRRQIPLLSNQHNFAVVADGNPCLSIYEAATVFHERFHTGHSAVAEGDYPELNGINVVQDLVELPSQLGEEYFYDRTVMKSFARNKDGKVIPDALLDKIEAARNFGAARTKQNQIFRGLLDIEIHRIDPARFKTPQDLYAFEDCVRARVGLPPRVSGHLVNEFTHILGRPVGYSSTFYSYLWDEAMVQDVKANFTALGDIYNQASAKKCRTLMARGNNADPAELYQELAGHPVQLDALFDSHGLKRPVMN